MELDEFISTALDQIIEGVNKAAASAASAGAEIGGRIKQTHPSVKVVFLENGGSASVVDFDLLVTSGNEQSGKSGGKLSVIGLGGANGELSATRVNEVANRIKFSVPVKFQ